MEGFHLSTSNIQAAIAESEKQGDKCAQIFVAGPFSYKMIKFSVEDEQAIKQTQMTLYVHSSYVTFPWKNNLISYIQIKREMEKSAELGAKAYILHLPKTPQNIGIVLKKLKRISDQINTEMKLAFEIVASADNSVEALLPIAKQLDQLGFKLCVDTAHLWGSGVDVSNNDTFKQWLENFDNIEVCHLNDSKVDLGSKLDRHAPVGEGKIWKDRKTEYNKTKHLLTELGIDMIHEY